MVLPKACTGFEFGFHDAVSMTKANTNRKLFDNWTVGAGSSIQVLNSPSPKNGTYFCRLQMAATATYFGWGSGTFGTGQRTLASSFYFRFPTSLPAGDTRPWVVDMPTSANPAMHFRNSDDRLIMCADGLIGNGQASTDAVVADTWYHMFIYLDCTTASRVMRWWIDGVEQTESTVGGQTVEDMGPWIWGSSGTGVTITEDIDDWVLWTDTVAMTGLPFGPHKVLLLKPDTGGTTTEFGTANRTARMITNSAADATHNSANILAALSEVPPLLGATATGVAQRVASTVADTDGVGIPMTTYSLAAGESIAGLRLEIVGWASTATANSLGIKTYNGTTLTGLEAGFTYDPNFDNSTTSPAWYCRMLAEAEYDTQAELDAWQVRLGYSDDISPLPGAHAVYGELAVKEASGGLSGNLGLNIETDTAQAFTRTKSKVTGLDTETDTAQALIRNKSKSTGLITETETALPITARKSKTVGLVTETDTAQPITLGGGQSADLGLVTETDTAQPLTHTKQKAVGLDTETDTAQTITRLKTKAIGLNTETETALPITARKSKTVGLVTEANTAQSMGKQKLKTTGLVTETDTALPVSGGLQPPLGIASEVDVALPITARKSKAVGLVSESELALSIARTKSRTVGLVTEADTGFALTHTKRKAIGLTTETDEALTLSTPAVITVEFAGRLSRQWHVEKMELAP